MRYVAPQRDVRPELQDALAVVRMRKWSILSVTVVMVGVAVFFSAQQTPVYQSEAAVLVTPLELDSDSGPIEPNLPTEEELAGSVAVAAIVVEDLGLDLRPRDLLGGLSVGSPTDTEILTLTYKNSDPGEARRRAQAFAEGYLEYRRRTVTETLVSSSEAIEQELQVLRERLEEVQQELASIGADDPRESSLESEASLLQGLILQRQLSRSTIPQGSTVGTIVQPAALPSSPVSPNHVTNAGFGLFAGLALGLGLAFLRDRLSGRLRTDEEIEAHLGASVLASIPRVAGWKKRKDAFLVTREQWRSPAAEAYRILRTNVLSTASSWDAKSILVTSAHTGEGKSATAANLGFVLARAGKSVILVSADLRRPRLHHFFGGRQAMGLSDVLTGRGSIEQTLTTFRSLPGNEGIDNLRLMSSGTIPENPAELLGSEAMRNVLRQLEALADFVVIDAPPVLPVTDAVVLAPIVNGVLLVVGPRSTTRTSVSSARQQLDKGGGRLMGAVLNGPDPSMTQTYYTY